MIKGQPVEDQSGDLAERLVREKGHKVVLRDLVPNETSKIRSALFKALEGGADVIVFIGGTGVSPKDVTIESIEPLFEKRLPGFGQIFRLLSFNKIGTAAVASRADAGIIRGALVACIPGSPDAVSLALQEILLPEAPHIVFHSREK